MGVEGIQRHSGRDAGASRELLHGRHEDKNGFSVFSEEGRVVRLICSVSPIAVSFCDVGNEGCANLKLNMWVFASGYCHELADSLYKTRIQECKAAAAFLGVQSLSDCSLDHLESSRLALTEAQYSRAKHVIEETHRVHDCVEVFNPLCAQNHERLLLLFLVSVSASRQPSCCWTVSQRIASKFQTVGRSSYI